MPQKGTAIREAPTMSETQSKTYPPSAEMSENANVDAAKYDAMYAASIADPDAFWGEHGKRIDWIKPYTQVKDVNYALGSVSINWYADGTLNVAANCIDRHLETRGDQTAIIWEPDSPTDEALHITYKQLHSSVCKMANVLKDLGVGKGDRVVIYMPMIPEAAYAMLACARIGAVCAATILIEMPEIGGMNRKQVASLTGVAPMTRQSGQWRGKSFIQGGQKVVRDALYMPALVAMRFNPDLKAKYQAMIKAGKPPKVALTALMRKLIKLANALIKANRLWVNKYA